MTEAEEEFLVLEMKGQQGGEERYKGDGSRSFHRFCIA
jgi:hypothetical protein